MFNIWIQFISIFWPHSVRTPQVAESSEVRPIQYNLKAVLVLVGPYPGHMVRVAMIDISHSPAAGIPIQMDRGFLTFLPGGEKKPTTCTSSI